MKYICISIPYGRPNNINGRNLERAQHSLRYYVALGNKFSKKHHTFEFGVE